MNRRGTAVGMMTSLQRPFSDQHVVTRGDARLAIDAKPGRGVALGIEIDNEHALADRGERGSEIDGGGGLADPALLVRRGENARPGPGFGLAIEGKGRVHGALVLTFMRTRRIVAFVSTTLGSASIS